MQPTIYCGKSRTCDIRVENDAPTSYEFVRNFASQKLCSFCSAKALDAACRRFDRFFLTCSIVTLGIRVVLCRHKPEARNHAPTRKCSVTIKP